MGAHDFKGFDIGHVNGTSNGLNAVRGPDKHRISVMVACSTERVLRDNITLLRRPLEISYVHRELVILGMTV